MKLRSTLFSAATGGLVAAVALTTQHSVKKPNEFFQLRGKPGLLAEIDNKLVFPENKDKETMMLILSSL
ncbi:MAG: hypothetical protein K0S08_1348 [Gammaproteobacteria bacterium]|jgi:hypothetical protein|nr:hypothetical protein [Gammaproteobacteria bacterium]